MITVDSDTIAEWLTIVYGTAGAEKILGLPRELRMELYHDVIMFGPAGDDVRVCLDRIPALLESQDPSIFPAVSFLEKAARDPHLVKRAYASRVLSKAGLDPADEILFWDWVKAAGYSRLSIELRRETRKLLGHDGFLVNGVTMLLWMLNGQYLFPQGMIFVDAECVKVVDTLLGKLDMPALDWSKGEPFRDWWRS